MRIELLFPEIADLYGDSANPRYLARAVPDCELIHTSLKARPRFPEGDIDLVYLGGLTESSQELAAAALLGMKDALCERIASGGLVLATGNASELFGQAIEDEDGRPIPALGLLPTVARRIRPERYNALYLGEFDAGAHEGAGADTRTCAGAGEEAGVGKTATNCFTASTIVGFNNRFSHTYGGEDVPPLFRTTRGTGRNLQETAEGFWQGGLMATYLLGPLLILNPPFTRWLLGRLGYPDAGLGFEAAAMASYELRLKEFSDPQTGFTYH